MGESTAIAWTDASFNIAFGCFKISPGCKNCYADTFTTNRLGLKLWGPPETTPRRVFGQKHWDEPLKWNKAAARAGVRSRVFSSSMCDIGEQHPTIIAERAKLWPLVRATPMLDWQLLSKRDWLAPGVLPDDWGEGYANVWLGRSVEDQEYADLRVPELLNTPAKTRFLSVEPMLGPVDFGSIKMPDGDHLNQLYSHGAGAGISWVICGGESGPGYRPMDHAWARSLRDQCVASGVAFFQKQSAAIRTEMGTYLIEEDGSKWAWKQYPRTPFNPDGDFAAPVQVP